MCRWQQPDITPRQRSSKLLVTATDLARHGRQIKFAACKNTGHSDAPAFWPVAQETPAIVVPKR